MAHYDLEEQEQIDSLKTWWKMYGNLVTGLVVAASLAMVGWQGWNWYQGGQSAKAAAIYGVLEQAAGAAGSPPLSLISAIKRSTPMAKPQAGVALPPSCCTRPS